MLTKPRLRVPPHTRLCPSNPRALASLASSKSSALPSSSSSSRPINPLPIQIPPANAAGPAPPASSVATAPSPGFAQPHSYFSFPHPSSCTSSGGSGTSVAGSAFLPKQTRRGFRSAHVRRARKGAEERDEINTESTEYSKSGGDAQSAAHEQAAFEPGRTEPESQRQKAGVGQDNNPLDASPANPDISIPNKNSEGPAKGGRESGRPSGGGSPSKAGIVSNK